MIIFVDIDDTICSGNYEGDYSNAEPIYENIDKINKLYDDGHEIKYWTARGSGTGIDWYAVTEKQLSDWKCKYHQLSVGEKPVYDLSLIHI